MWKDPRTLAWCLNVMCTGCRFFTEVETVVSMMFGEVCVNSARSQSIDNFKNGTVIMFFKRSFGGSRAKIHIHDTY